MRSFVYLHAVDVEAARRFYRDIAGLTEIFAAPDGSTVGFVAGELQVTVSHHGGAADAGESGSDWSSQLGWEGGTAPTPSWGFELADDRFADAVAAARAFPVPSVRDEPEWVGYWSFPVRDPMGNTVELSAAGRDAWPGSGGADR